MTPFLSPAELAALRVATERGLRRAGHRYYRTPEATPLRFSGRSVDEMVALGMIERPAAGRETIFATPAGRLALSLHNARAASLEAQP